MKQSTLPDSFFRKLDSEEEEKFKQWARDNFDPNKEVDPTWHPVVRAEWQRLAARWESRLHEV